MTSLSECLKGQIMIIEGRLNGTLHNGSGEEFPISGLLSDHDPITNISHFDTTVYILDSTQENIRKRKEERENKIKELKEKMKQDLKTLEELEGKKETTQLKTKIQTEEEEEDYDL